VTTTSLLNFFDVLRLRCSPPFVETGAGAGTGIGAGGGWGEDELDVEEVDAEGSIVGAGFGSTC
jgi:hypothetical protein